MKDYRYMASVLDVYLQSYGINIHFQKLLNLLNNPIGNSFKGLCNALEHLHIKNEVFHIPSDLLSQMKVPNIVQLQSQNHPLGIITKIDSKEIRLCNVLYG